MSQLNGDIFVSDFHHHTIKVSALVLVQIATDTASVREISERAATLCFFKTPQNLYCQHRVANTYGHGYYDGRPTETRALVERSFAAHWKLFDLTLKNFFPVVLSPIAIMLYYKQFLGIYERIACSTT